MDNSSVSSQFMLSFVSFFNIQSSIFLHCYNILMFRNHGIERSNSAGTRVVASRKLPSDFFTPSKSCSKKDKAGQSQFKMKDAQSIDRDANKDAMLFTFNQVDSAKQLGLGESSLKLKRVGSSKVVKFPPVLLKLHREPS